MLPGAPGVFRRRQPQRGERPARGSMVKVSPLGGCKQQGKASGFACWKILVRTGVELRLRALKGSGMVRASNDLAHGGVGDVGPRPSPGVSSPAYVLRRKVKKCLLTASDIRNVLKLRPSTLIQNSAV
ncbi:hypothetical protein AV530_003021 [Patagioenas fasciata monilis]|uniref:Uncharacterized protein n=1 Tax=Patagioenas fasciata monilis TaxID=372326 RepID=A0A1V4KVS8_PATFA|nr:hypothetical protein AV530_003021 [Patagioenas fasciata monilis]